MTEQENQKFNFDDNFQQGILELMMSETTFCTKCCSYLQGHYFKNEYYSYFFETIKKLYDKYSASPSSIQLKNEILKIPITKQENYITLLNRIVRPQLQRDHDYIKENLSEYVYKNALIQMNHTIVDLNRKNNNPERIALEVQKELDNLKTINFNSSSCQMLSDMDLILEESKNDSGELVPLYMPSIDHALGGGVPKCTLFVALSGTNVGKSIFLINWAYHLIKNNYKVLYINLEGYDKQAMVRLASRVSGAPAGKARYNDFTEAELAKKTDFNSKYGANLRIVNKIGFRFTIDDLVPILRQTKEEFDYDVILLDYGQILKSKLKYENVRLEQASVHRDLSALAGELKCVVGTVAQGNRETQVKNNTGSSLIRMNDISECFEICRAAATVVTLNRSLDDIDMDRVRVLLDKQREGRTNVIEVCKTDFSRMAFYGDETEGLGYMNVQDYHGEKK